MAPTTFGATAGSSQTAGELAKALEACGNDVHMWSPPPIPSDIPGWRHTRWRRTRLQEFLLGRRFDWIDLPPNFATNLSRESGPLVARSVQPNWLYFRSEVGGRLRQGRPRAAIDLLYGLHAETEYRRGLRRAAAILCLGSLEYAWLSARLPRLAGRMRTYRIAPPETERSAFRSLAKNRSPLAAAGRFRWLWIGRWTVHKGRDELARWARARLASFPQDRLTLAGTGAIDLSASQMPTNRLTVLPLFSRAELPALLEAHDGGLFTSRVEGWGLTLQEMLESGLQVFATKAGAVPDLQPFFPHRLKPFPPVNEREPQAFNEAATAEYDHRFSWRSIAADYVQQVEEVIHGDRG